MKTLKIPETKEEAAEIYMKRRKAKKAYLKYDMWIGGMNCCSDTETLHLGMDCEICNHHCDCGQIACIDAVQETLRMRWDERIES